MKAPPHQAVPARVVVGLVLENVLEVENPFVQNLAFFAVAIVESVLRPRHLQRSDITVAEGRIIGNCSRGKARREGR